jgi:hypothetical protein
MANDLKTKDIQKQLNKMIIKAQHMAQNEYGN